MVQAEADKYQPRCSFYDNINICVKPLQKNAPENCFGGRLYNEFTKLLLCLLFNILRVLRVNRLVKIFLITPYRFPEIIIEQDFIEQRIFAGVVSVFEVEAPKFAEVLPIYGGDGSARFFNNVVTGSAGLAFNHFDENHALCFIQLFEAVFKIFFKDFFLFFSVLAVLAF